ncbi:hypothetical protein [Jannaschia sp. M317]|uniref:hypothetical protein n=1 Tax=Jannaschia sp. M317 TaxID=2867011 RepID=UPI0021A72F9C|nr:hypothetical protein [Jannaschia sp. M317]UWQ16161.1 hypothetical protein K3551_09440 [Jannaschia sp. M317]
MRLTFSPVRRDDSLSVDRQGDTLILNGEAFDFSALPEGAILPRSAIVTLWVAGDVTREGGVLTIPLILPHGPAGPDETRFAQPLTLTENGPVTLPPFDAEVSA